MIDLKEESTTIKFKKINVPFMILMSNITLGIYVPYWILKRKVDFMKMEKNNTIPFNAVKMVFFIYLLLAVLFIISPLFLTDYGLELKNSFDHIVTFYSLGIIMYTIFRIRETINDYLEEEVIKAVPLFLFHIWYLQYKINRSLINRGDENEKKIS